MSRVSHSPPAAADRDALRRRVHQMYEWLNQGAWSNCWTLVDPNLRRRGRVEEPSYIESLRRFCESYGKIAPWHVRISLHLDVSSNKHDVRPFAYVFVVWQDQAHAFHMFRERWVRDDGRWYTRVAGLVPNVKGPVAARD